MKLTFRGGPFDGFTMDRPEIASDGLHVVLTENVQRATTFTLYMVDGDDAKFVSTSDTPWNGLYLPTSRLTPPANARKAQQVIPAEKTPFKRTWYYSGRMFGKTAAARNAEELLEFPRGRDTTGMRAHEAIKKFMPAVRPDYLYDEPVETTALHEIVEATAELDQGDNE